MTFPQAVAELRTRFPRAAVGPTAIGGECYNRAVGVEFAKSKNWLYLGRDAQGRQLMVYYNESEHLIF